MHVLLCLKGVLSGGEVVFEIKGGVPRPSSHTSVTTQGVSHHHVPSQLFFVWRHKCNHKCMHAMLACMQLYMHACESTGEPDTKGTPTCATSTPIACVCETDAL